jgi:DNA-binding transcriptional ArsR family regulator
VAVGVEATIWVAVGDPRRRQVLEILRVRPRSVNELVGLLGLSQPGVSKHLRVLLDAGLVSVRPDGRRRLYALEAEPLRALERWLDPFRVFWSDSLDALEQHLDETCSDKTTAHP